MKTALITGASSGIGRDIARELSARGWRLILAARRKDRLEALARELDTPCRICVCDLSREDEVRALYEQTRSEPVEMLVNAAGFGLQGSFLATDLDRELEMVRVNICALHILTKLYLHDMVNRDHGYILNVASSAGFLAGPFFSTYYASKNYVVRLTQAIYEELRAQGSRVSVSCLCPGPVETEFNQVAGASFGVKAISSRAVARAAVQGTLNRKLTIVPGAGMKLSLFASRLAPEKLLLRINGHIQKNKGR
ncbi:MAG: SDR family NAD(P)-dependent oxidoreductase [Butyricicoccaceae bacterium]